MQSQVDLKAIEKEDVVNYYVDNSNFVVLDSEKTKKMNIFMK